jgi:hypothetical protein
MDNLSIERVWEDIEFFEVEITAQSKLVCAKVKSYIQDPKIDELVSRLTSFPKSINDRYYWENGKRGDDWTPFVSLEFWCEDKLGHVVIEVYIEIDDGASYTKHNCCFFVKTDIGLLNSFGKSLALLNERGIGKIITLNAPAL